MLKGFAQTFYSFFCESDFLISLKDYAENFWRAPQVSQVLFYHGKYFILAYKVRLMTDNSETL